MKKIISIKAQNIISFIPFLNAVVLFIWIHNYRVSAKESSVFAKSLLIMFAVTIPLAIIQGLLMNLYAEYETIVLLINYIAIYLIPFLLARSLICFQKKIFTSI